MTLDNITLRLKQQIDQNDYAAGSALLSHVPAIDAAHVLAGLELGVAWRLFSVCRIASQAAIFGHFPSALQV